MHTLGDAPSVLHPSDPDAVAMAQGGYWITDFHSVFAGGALFRAGKWKPTRVDVHDGGEHQVWWGLDAGGAIAALVVDVSNALLREFDRRQPTAEDPRRIANSCPRIVDDEPALVRRLEHLRAMEQIAIEPGVELSEIAKAFFAQKSGNLRRWLVDAPHVSEVFYSD